MPNPILATVVAFAVALSPVAAAAQGGASPEVQPASERVEGQKAIDTTALLIGGGFLLLVLLLVLLDGDDDDEDLPVTP